jgi:hypothetical protein
MANSLVLSKLLPTNMSCSSNAKRHEVYLFVNARLAVLQFAHMQNIAVFTKSHAGGHRPSAN